MTGTTKNLTKTGLDEPNDSMHRRKPRRRESGKLVYFNCRKRHLNLRSSCKSRTVRR
jgi:hypothetical protein